MARAADAITMDRFLATDLQVATKPDLSPVTEADRATEHALRDLIAAHRPNDSVVGEEFGGSGPGELPDGRAWIIDPIDGTKNYVRGVPVWATLIGLVVDGVPVLGMVSAPALGRRWWGSSGGGAWATALGCAPRQLQTSTVAQLRDASFSYSDRAEWIAHDRIAGFDALGKAVWRTRAYGDFYSHVLVAEGAVDIAAEPKLNVWDMAALVPIVVEAGGRLTGFDGSPALAAGCAVTTNGLLHRSVLDMLSPTF